MRVHGGVCMCVCVCRGGCVCLLSKPWEQGAFQGCEAGSQGLQQYICCCFSPKHPPFPGESFLSPPFLSPSFPPFSSPPPPDIFALAAMRSVRLLPPLCQCVSSVLNWIADVVRDSKCALSGLQKLKVVSIIMFSIQHNYLRQNIKTKCLLKQAGPLFHQAHYE